MSSDLHQGQPVIQTGTDLERADLVVILLHGRGATAESMVPIAEAIYTEGVCFLIPQAAMDRWYPNTAFGPFEDNEPDLSSALSLIGKLVGDARERGFSDEQIVFGGFSQGACLASEYVIRSPGNYGGLFMLSGALIGPPGMDRNHPGEFNGMPVFIGGSDVDPWVPHDLMKETASVFEKMGAEVVFRTYPGMAHTVNQDELDRVRELLIQAQ